jgi:hypothetical protein
MAPRTERLDQVPKLMLGTEADDPTKEPYCWICWLAGADLEGDR